MSNEAFDSECYTEGCRNPVFFRGFGRAICQSCYARLLENGGFYHLTGQIHKSTIPQDLTEKKTCGRVGQLEIEWENEG